MGVMDKKVALIAGASASTGEAISLKLAKDGARVVVADSDQELRASIEKKISQNGYEIKSIAVDMTKASDVEAVVKNIVEESGGIDILVNCMDSLENKSISDITIEEWLSSVNTNLTSAFLFLKYVVSEMKLKKFGRIVNLNDLNYLGMPGYSHYSAVKSGIFGLTRSLSLELARDGITVNSVVKGEIREPGVELSEEELENAAKRMPVQRLGTPEDIAYAVSFFAAESSRYVTGQTLFVCGGKSIYSSMSV